MVDKTYFRLIIKKLTEHFESNPCVDCGETDATLLDFSDQEVWKAISSRSRWPRVYQKIRACDSICVSCQRRRLVESTGPWGITT